MTGPRLVIADDHPIFRRGLRSVLEAAGLVVAGEAGDGEAALSAIRQHVPDVAVLDLEMPKGDGLDVARAVHESGLPTRLIVLTLHKSVALFDRALALGVRGYLLKDGALTEIVAAVQAISAGKSYISPQMSGHLLERRSRAAALATEHPGLAGLTPAETRVLRLIAADKTSREIAAALFISVRTVEHHRASICRKLGLQGSNSLLRFAAAHRLEIG